MNGSASFSAELLEGIGAGAAECASAHLLVCPPFPYLGIAGEMLAGSGVSIGAQNVSEHTAGAFTGEISASMLADVGVSHVLVGHSERRTLYGESSQQVAEKFAAAKAAGLIPILCVGETLEQREDGDTEQVVGEQIDAVLSQQTVSAFAAAMIAYEPVWAIGTGKTATPETAGAVHTFIRERIGAHDADIAQQLPLLYGGSMKPDNAAGLMAQADIDGGLIGGASLKAEDFLAIAREGVAATE